MLESRRTINIHTGKELSDKSRDEILEAIFQIYGDKFEIIAVQENYEVICVTFGTEAAAMDALKEKGVRLFGIWCRVDGGPHITIIHLFEFPHEEGDDLITQISKLMVLLEESGDRSIHPVRIFSRALV